MVKYFSCKVGECGTCCTKTKSIPVTMGDLYRSYVLEKSQGSSKTFSQVFDERCNGWIAFPSQLSPFPLPVPISRIPCYSFDIENKRCKVYGKAQYVTCSAYPEECLLPVEPGAIDFFELSKDSKDFASSLDCLKEVKLSKEQKTRTIKIAKLRSVEMTVTGMNLNPPAFPILFDYTTIEDAKAGLEQMIKLLSKESYMRRQWKSISQTQKEYMKLFKVKFPDYTALVI